MSSMESAQQVVVEEATCRQSGFRRDRPALPKMASLGLGVWSFHSRPRGHAGFARDNTTGFAQDMDNLLPFDVLKDPCVCGHGLVLRDPSADFRVWYRFPLGQEICSERENAGERPDGSSQRHARMSRTT